MSIERRIDRFDKYIAFKGLNDNRVTKDLVLSVGSLGKSRKEGRDLSDRIVAKILNFYTDINKIWLLTGDGEMIIVEDNSMSDVDNNQEAVKIIIDSNYVTVAPLVDQYAQAGWMSGYSDKEFVSQLPKYIAAAKYSEGNYTAFEVRGDSMNDGTIRSICEYDQVLGRELNRIYWKYPLRLKEVFIIVHKTEGVVIKEIKSQDLASGEILLHSWNTKYKDYPINLNDVEQIFYVKELRRSNYNRNRFLS